MLDFSVTFIITIINITVLFLILRAVLFKPVTKFMADRAKKVQDSIEQAEKDRADAKKLLAQYEGKLNQADAEAELILKAAREDAQAEAAGIIAGGNATAEALLTAARGQIETERQAAFARLKVEAAALVIAASSRLVQREFNSGDNQRYADMLLDELAARKG